VYSPELYYRRDFFPKSLIEKWEASAGDGWQFEAMIEGVHVERGYGFTLCFESYDGSMEKVPKNQKDLLIWIQKRTDADPIQWIKYREKLLSET